MARQTKHAIRQAFLQPDHKGASETWRHVADQLRPRWPKLGALMDDAEADVLARRLARRTEDAPVSAVVDGDTVLAMQAGVGAVLLASGLTRRD